MSFKFLLTILTSVCLVACTNSIGYKTVPLNSFKIKNELLADKTLVKVLSFSGMPDNNPNTDYYIHMLIVSVATHDTFNFLSIATAGILEDPDKEMHYFSQNSDMYESVLNSLQSEQKDKIIEPIQVVKIDSDFEANIKNNYPTVIGLLGTVNQSQITTKDSSTIQSNLNE